MGIHDIIQEFDIEGKRFDEIEFIAACGKCDEQTKNTLEYRSEVFAFQVIENYHSDCDIFEGKFYYGPLAVSQNSNRGETMEYPDRRSISPKMISYWETRAHEANNLTMRCRYAGLVYEFKKYVTKTVCDISIARKYIESLIIIATNDIQPYLCMNKQAALRAISLSHKLRQQDLLDEDKKSLKDLLTRHNAEYQMDILSAMYQLSKDCRGAYANEELKEIIAGLDALFDKMAQDIAPHLCDMMEIADILADYYQNKDSDRISGIFAKVEKAFNKERSRLTNMQMINNYNQLHHILLKYKQHYAAAKLSIKIAELGKGVHDEMNEFSADIEITQDNMDAIISPIFKYSNAETAFSYFAKFFIPNKSHEKKSFERESAKYFTSVIPTHLFDSKGRLKTIVGNTRTDFDGNLILHVSMSMKFHSIFMNAAIRKGISKGIFTTENILSYISKSTAVKSDRFSIIKKGLDAYFAEDYIVAIHLIIPQLEECIRNIAEAAAIPTLKQIKNGNGFQARQLDDMLRDPVLTKILTEDLTYYLRILLTDIRGWNLRNTVCHGLASLETFGSISADYLIHSLLCLGTIRTA